MKLDYSVQEESNKYYWLYKYLKRRCNQYMKTHRNECVKGFPFYPIYQCPYCRYWWNNMLKSDDYIVG